jgi:hypothetical protein
MIWYKPSDFSANNAFRVSGFTFNLNQKNQGINLDQASSSSVVLQTKIRIDHNTFTGDTGAFQCQAITYAAMRGVVDNNLFDNIRHPIRCAIGYGTGLTWWNAWEAIVYGKTDGNMYFEDNTFTGVEWAIDSGVGNRYIFRYNTITASADWYPLFDIHGNDAVSRSSFGGELYGNLILGNYGGIFVDHRGGKLLTFGNVLATGSVWIVNIRDELNDAATPTDNPSPQYPNDSYTFLNRKAYTGTFLTETVGGTTDNPPLYGTPLENREFFMGTDSFDGTVGVGYGILAARPVTCTTGVGYWATNQSCSNLTGMVGANPTTPISGTLYKCTAPNTWTAYYTPYTYPHPLRTEATDTTPPAAPTGLTVQ